MGFFLPLVGGALTTAGGFVIRQVAKRPILSAAGALIGYQFVNKDDDSVIGEFLPDELDTALDQLLEAGIDVVEEGAAVAGDITLAVIRGAGIAFIEGIEGVGEYLVRRLKQNPVDNVAAITFSSLMVLTAVFMFSRARRGGQ